MESFAAEGSMPYQVGGVGVSPYNAGALTIPANLSGYPAISIPAGLAIGMQACAASRRLTPAGPSSHDGTCSAVAPRSAWCSNLGATLSSLSVHLLL
jgi:hypothetical protein